MKKKFVKSDALGGAGAFYYQLRRMQKTTMMI